MICSVVSVSRAPVGSSASSSTGFCTMARAMDTRCCCPPDSSLGWWCMRSPSPTRSRATRGPAPALGAGDPAVQHRQLDVGQGRVAGQQVELLEHEADVLVPELGQRPVAQHRRRPGRPGCTCRWSGRSSVPTMFSSVDLPGARRAHDRDHLAPVDADVDVAQRMHLGRAHPVDLRDLSDAQKHVNASQPRPSGPSASSTSPDGNVGKRRLESTPRRGYRQCVADHVISSGVDCRNAAIILPFLARPLTSEPARLYE